MTGGIAWKLQKDNNHAHVQDGACRDLLVSQSHLSSQKAIKENHPQNCTQAHESNWEHTLHGFGEGTSCSNKLTAFCDEMNGSVDEGRTLDVV